MNLEQDSREVRFALRKLAGYTHTAGYLWQRFGPRRALSFALVKAFVMEGEGGWGLISRRLDRALRVWPGLKPAIVPYPRNVEIEVTTVCDKRCVICEHTYWRGFPKRHLRLDEFRHIVDQFPRAFWVNTVGEGDAFLNPDFIGMLALLASRDITSYLDDSFDLLDRRAAVALLDLGVAGIWISMDAATPETYESIKVGCDYQRVVENIRGLIDLKRQRGSPVPEISFRYIVTTLNVAEMPRFVDFVADLGGRDALGPGSQIEFAGLLPFPEIAHLAVPEIPPEIMAETKRRAAARGVRVTTAHANMEALPPAEHCVAWQEPYIMMGGHALPCCAVMQCNDRSHLVRHALGNVFQQHFRDIWNSPRYRRFRALVPRRDAPVPLLCRGCRAFDTRRREALFGVDADT